MSYCSEVQKGYERLEIRVWGDLKYSLKCPIANEI